MARREKMLVVDDVKMNRVILEGIFGKQYDIIHAENGKEALDLLDENQEDISVMILDILMPVLDGYGVLKAMQKRKLINKIPVVAISAFDTAENEVNVLEMGAADYIEKPFEAEVVIRRVKNVITSYKYRRYLENRLNVQQLSADYEEKKQVLDMLPEYNSLLTYLDVTVIRIDTHTNKYKIVYENDVKLTQLETSGSIEELCCFMLKFAKSEYSADVNEWISDSISSPVSADSNFLPMVFPLQNYAYEEEWLEASILRSTDDDGVYSGILFLMLKSQNNNMLARRELQRNYEMRKNLETYQAENVELRQKAQMDLLTAIYNKQTSENIIRKYLEILPNKMHALMILDLDNFKRINDDYGHANGDNVLRQMGKQLSKNFRESDIVGRFGGDEFIVFMKEINDKTIVETKAGELLKSLKECNISPVNNFYLGVSIGIAIFPYDGIDFTQLFENADKALYAAKGFGKNQYRFYGDIVEQSLLESTIAEKKDAEQLIAWDEKISGLFCELGSDERALNYILRITAEKYNLAGIFAVSKNREDTSYSFNISVVDWDINGEAIVNGMLAETEGKKRWICSDRMKCSEEIKDAMNKASIKSAIALPVYVNNENWGGIIFASSENGYKWDIEKEKVCVAIGKMVNKVLSSNYLLELMKANTGLSRILFKSIGSEGYVIDDKYNLRMQISIQGNLKTVGEETKCYKAFWNMDKPCEICPMTEIRKKETVKEITQQGKNNHWIITAAVLNADSNEKYYIIRRQHILGKYTNDMRGMYDELYEIDFLKNKYDLIYNEGTKFKVVSSNGEIDVLKGKLIKKFIAKEDINRFQNFFSREFIKNEIEAGKNRIIGEFKRLSIDGKYRRMLSVIVPVDRENYGKISEKCLCIMIDTEEEKDLLYWSEKDPLTHEYNQYSFEKALELLLKKNSNEKYALICLDINRFKLINELFGMENGNIILKSIADEIRKISNDSGICARVHSDLFEFCIPYYSNSEIVNVLKEIENNIKNKFPAINPKFSFGIYKEIDSELSVNVICDRAYLALKSIKGNVVKNWAFYTSALRDKEIEERRIEDSMENALINHEFEVYFQPQYDVRTKKISGAEGLVRWHHPSHGIMYPDKFIPLLERNGFIVKLDEYVWRETCKTISNWDKEGYDPIIVSVNFSRIHLYEKNMTEKMKAVAEEYNISPDRIKLEITETAIFDDKDRITEVLKEIHTAGFEVSIDDFGSGCSSLNMLKDIWINEIKLDRFFLSTTQNTKNGRIIIESIIDLAKKLNLKIVAEGVETEKQLCFLEDIGCDTVQGFYFSKPVREPEFKRMLSKTK